MPNTAIALGVRDLKIPSQAESMNKALTLEHLQGQNDLNRLKIAQAPEELRIAQAKAGLDAKNTQLGIDAKQSELMTQLAASVAYASPEQQAVIYPQMAAEWKRLGLPNSEKVPDQWNPEMLPHLQAIASRGQTVDKQGESANYRALAGPGSATAAPVGNAQPNTLNALSAPAVPNFTGPKAQKLPYSENAQALISQGQQTGIQTGPNSMALPTETVTAKRPGITPDDYRKEAARLQSFGTKEGDNKAKVFLDEANRLDDRIGREFNQTEQIRVREEAMALRKSNQGNQSRVNASKLADDFRQEPGVKDYRTVQPLVASMENAITKDTGTADLDMVYALAKIFDPGSVVREGEQILVVKAGGLPSQVQDWIGWVNGGQRLNPQVRQGMLEQAHSRQGNYKQAYDSAVQSYTDQAKRWELDPRDIVRDYKVVSEGSKGKGPRKGGSGTQADPFKIQGDDGFGAVKSGEFYTGPDGVLRKKP